MTSSIKIIDKDLGAKEIFGKIGKMELSIEVGLFGEGDPASNVAARGAVHQHGSIKANIPARPFESMAFDNGEKALKDFIINRYKAATEKRISVKTMMDQIGIFHTDQIKNTIVTGPFISLKSATIRRKGSAKPLIDKAIMKNSVKHKIAK